MAEFRLNGLILGALIGAPFFMAGPAAAEEIAWEALDMLPAEDVVLLGEIHDNPHHHRAQAQAIASLQPAAVVFEMLTPEQADLVTAEALADLSGLGDLLGWEDSGWPDFDLYAPVFAALGDARVFGAALPRGEVRAAFSDGAAEVFGPGAALFGLDQPLAEAEQSAREELQFLSHCEAMPLEMMGGMVEAQRLRDAAFARTIMAANKITGGPVAVIMGSGHTRTDWGVPAVLRVAAPDLRVLSIGMLEAAPAEGEVPPYDYWLVTRPEEREDPCAAFR